MNRRRRKAGQHKGGRGKTKAKETEEQRKARETEGQLAQGRDSDGIGQPVTAEDTKEAAVRKALESIDEGTNGEGKSDWKFTRSAWLKVMGSPTVRNTKILKVWTDGGSHFKGRNAIYALGEMQGMTREQLADELEDMGDRAKAEEVRAEGDAVMPLMVLNFFAPYHGHFLWCAGAARACVHVHVCACMVCTRER